MVTATATNGTSIPEQNASPLTVEGLEVGYGDTVVLRNVSLEVPANSVIALVGPNGAGKTTLLKAVSGLLPLRSGRVLLDGKDISKLEHYRRSRLGLCHIPEGRGDLPLAHRPGKPPYAGTSEAGGRRHRAGG